MRLILREYLSQLKEDGEIDAVLPDLLLAMGVQPINRPGRGRQFGVDIPAVGVDPTTSPRERKLFLVTAKRGNLGRRDWDSGPDAIRQSLEDILDSYLARSVAVDHAGLPVKIILATGGDMKQTVQPSWDGYKRRHQGTIVHGHRVEFEFWGGDALADRLQRYLVDEYLFPNDYQRTMRRTLAFVGVPDADLSAFETLVAQTTSALPNGKSSSDKKARLKSFRALRLGLSTVYRWGLTERNTRPAMLLAEYTALQVWGSLTRNGLTHPRSNDAREALACVDAWRTAAGAYVEAITPACCLRDGLYGHSEAESIEYPLRTFEVMGHLAVVGLDRLHQAARTSGFAAVAQRKEAQETASLLAQTIANNSGALSPPYDEHAIEVTLTVLLLAQTGRSADAQAYIRALATRLLAAHRLGHPSIPLFRASYTHLSDLALSIRPPALPSSMLLLRLAELSLLLNDDALYLHVKAVVAAAFAETHLQVWHPDADTDPALYEGRGTDTGFTLGPLTLAPDAPSARAHLSVALPSGTPIYSADNRGLPVLSLLASRRFRTPLRPSMWRTPATTP